MKNLFYRIRLVTLCLIFLFTCIPTSANEGISRSPEKILSKIFKKIDYIRYDYNDNWHVSIVKSGDTPKIWYFYDDQCQLIRENNKVLNKTVTYSYDARGNILVKKTYPFTENNLGIEIPECTIKYDYTSLDKLISINDQKITYDKFGNPTQYRDSLKFIWKNVRNLSTVLNPNNNIQYDYGKNGYRTKKTVNGITTEFVYRDDTMITLQKSKDNVIKWYTPEEGKFASFNHNGTDYLYIRNMPGDIIGIADFSGNVVANYTYDSWGKLISITDKNGKDVTFDKNHIGFINPLRYRGYYYDFETNLYYLLSRYYDPETGRFINEDSREDMLSSGFSNDDIEEYNNLYVYCYNNPVNYVDKEGRYGTPIQWACAVIGGVAGWFFGDYVAKKFGFTPNDRDWKKSMNYWLIRSGVVAGGAVVGWFSGTAVMKISAAFLLSNPDILEKMPAMLRWFFGLDIGGKKLAPESVADFILSARRVGKAQKNDLYHRAANFLSRSQLTKGKVYFIVGKDNSKNVLLQTYGKVNNKSGVFEYIISKGGTITHQFFKVGGIIDGIANTRK